jgi:predicted CoA-binding protein
MLRDAHPAILETLRQAQSLHILGAGHRSEKPAHQAIHDLIHGGWRLVPIHPRDVGGSILGRPIRRRLEVHEHPEVVVFFLAPERALEVVRELVMRYEADAMPLLWFQPGSEHEEVLEMLNEMGVLHIVDDCIVRFIQRHHLTAATTHNHEAWYLQVASSDNSGCSIWTVEHSLDSQAPPTSEVEWCGDRQDLERSEESVPRYIRSLIQPGEGLAEAAERLAA